MSGGRVLLTGATGFVGRAVLDRLLAEDREVAALVRSEESRHDLERLGARPLFGDVLDRTSLDRAVRDCEVVYHVAGINAFCLCDPAPMHRVNVEGSLNVVDAAARAGVRRIVYTSSAATLGERRGVVADEDSEHRGWFLSHYERSKFDAERAVLQRAGELEIEMVSVNPSSVQGPGRTGGTGKVLIGFLRGSLKAFVDTQMSLVDIADCAEAHVLAEDKGEAGRRYVVSGATMAVSDALEVVGRITGLERRPRLLPAGVATAGGAAVEAVMRLRRRDAPVCREMVRTLLHGHRYDGSRASRELGLAYTPVEVTLGRTIEWLIDEGLVPGSTSGT